MALNIKNRITEQLAHELARTTGESLTEAVTTALRDRLDRISQRAASAYAYPDVEQIQAVVHELPDLDTRSPDEILYDPATGLPT